MVHDIEQLQCLRALCLEGNSVGVEAARAIAKALEGKNLLQVQICVWFICVFFFFQFSYVMYGYIGVPKLGCRK